MDILCPDAVPGFLNLFDFSIAPQLLFYTYIPVVVVSFFVSLYALIRDRFSLVSRLLFVVSISFILWVINIFFAWVAAYAGHVMFSWAVTPIFESLIFASSLYFTYVFIDEDKKDISYKIKLVILLICLPVFVILPTKISIKYFDLSICEGVPAFTWYYYMYALEILSIFWVIFICTRKYIKLGKGNLERNKIIYFMVGMASFLSLFVVSNLVGQITLIQEISFLGSLGMAIFIGLLAYLIVQYKIFNIKLLAAQVLVVGITILVVSQFLFIQNNTNKILTAITFAIVSIFGWWLVKSVKTEIKHKEELAVMNEELKKLDQAKNEFINIASHQLRTPVTVIKGTISMLQDGTMDSFDAETKKRFYDGARFKCQKLEDIIDDILNATSLTNKKFNAMDKDMEKINVKEFFGKMIEEFRPETMEREIDLSLGELDETVPDIFGQRQYLEEAFSNLITNAIKYTPSPKQTIDVRDKRDGKAAITISNRREGNDIIFSVKDNGIGIPADAMPNLFQKFVRAKNAVDMYTDGTGLGLFIVKEIIEGHGGKAWVKSELGKGSEFFVKLPIRPSSEVDVKEYIRERADMKM